MEVCSSYKKKDKRVTVISKKRRESKLRMVIMLLNTFKTCLLNLFNNNFSEIKARI
ncbi:hypothetical protein PDL10_02035 [Bacillus cereus]|nr:hypothetical protein [Bacillus cereus]